jgi:hypothetical protein
MSTSAIHEQTEAETRRGRRHHVFLFPALRWEDKAIEDATPRRAA